MYLLDTCTLLWLASNPELLSSKAMKIIKESSNPLYVSSISAYEIGVKYYNKKLTLKVKPRDWFRLALEHYAVSEIPISSEIAACAYELPKIHDDPFDRMIMATAIVHSGIILTPDKQIGRYRGVENLW